MPRFAFRMIRLFVGMCGAETETLAVVREFTFFYSTSNGSDYFCTVFLYIFFIFLILAECFKYQKYGECSDYYRLSCFRQILFLMHSLIVLMKLSIHISGLSHEKVILL